MERKPNVLVHNGALLFGGMLIALPLGVAADCYNKTVLIYCAVSLGTGSYGMLIVGILWEMFRNFQWPLLELLLTVFGGSLAMIYAIHELGICSNALTAGDVGCLAFYLTVGLLITFPGTLWALTWIRALGVHNALGRAVLVVLAWAALLSPFALLFAVGNVILIFAGGSTIFGAANRASWILAGKLLCASLVFVPALWVERRANRGSLRVAADHSAEATARKPATSSKINWTTF